MRRIALITALFAAIGVGFAASAGADDTHEYKIEMYNAFGIVEGSDIRIAGVNAGAVIDLDVNEDKNAVVEVELSGDLAELGEDTECSTEPQSLIAEYFIDCDPKGPPLDEGGTVPAEQVSQTVQPDLVANTLREPYNRRLQLLITEFGTALAGNGERLNEAIRLGAPALTETRKATKILAEQNRIIRDLNTNSDVVVAELTRVREDAVEFVDETEDAAAASAARREDLSRDFALLDDFLAELNPTLAELENLAVEQTPLLADLRASASGLSTLAVNLPGFSSASEDALVSLGDAARVGQTALSRGRDEIELLADAGRKAPVTAEALADFVSDIDDPRRSVEIDERAGVDTGRTDPRAGQRDTKGYTGFESLLNWMYYLTGTSSQFDQIAHSMHINLNAFETGHCGHAFSGRSEQGAVGVPVEDGSTLTPNGEEAARCVQWLGPNQPGINEDLGLPPYDPAVCPNGTAPDAALPLCNPGTPSRKRAKSGSSSPDDGRGSSGGAQNATGAEDDGGDGGVDGTGAPAETPSDEPVDPGGSPPENLLEDLLDIPSSALEDLPNQLQDSLQGLGSGTQNGGGGGAALPSAEMTEELLDFLFAN